MSSEQVVKLELTFESKGQARLILSSPNGASTIASGAFDVSTVDLAPEHNLGPGIFTSWQEGWTNTRLGFDFSGRVDVLTGFFVLGGRKVAAVIDARNRAKLRLFSPETGNWWTVE